LGDDKGFVLVTVFVCGASTKKEMQGRAQGVRRVWEEFILSKFESLRREREKPAGEFVPPGRRLRPTEGRQRIVISSAEEMKGVRGRRAGASWGQWIGTNEENHALAASEIAEAIVQAPKTTTQRKNVDPNEDREKVVWEDAENGKGVGKEKRRERAGRWLPKLPRRL